ncbi:MAG: hypothetical protein ACLP59_04620 [Bryobacteraceae bacterium]
MPLLVKLVFRCRAVLRVSPVICCLLLALAFPPGIGRAQSGQPANAVVPIQVLYLARGGCQPAQITRKAGQFVLLVINLSFQSNVQVALHSADGTAQAEQQFSTTQRNWVQLLNLPAGKYTLDGANSPHRCKITIE